MNAATSFSCEGCRSPVEPHDLRCAVCARATPATRAPAPVGARVLRCDGCGAAIAYVAEAQAPRCAFCKHTMHVEQPTDPIEIAELLLPFSVTPALANEAFGRWLRSLGFFRPNDLAQTAQVEGLTPISWCAWLVDGDAHVSWTADSDAGSRRSSWAPHAGETSMPFRSTVVPASRGLRPDECMRLVPSYDMRWLVPIGQGQAGAVVEQFDVQRSSARRTVVEALEREAAHRITTNRVVPGSRFRNVHVSILLQSLHTRRVVLPAYVLSYRYRGEVHRAIVHGQDAFLAFGTAPWSYRKIALVVLAVIVVIALIALGLSTQ